MSWLQPKLHLKVAQKQILTPGLVQMVSVLALNRPELREMITQEMVANPMLEELTDDGPASEDYSEEAFIKAETEKVPETEPANPFDEFDIASFFNQYLDSGSGEGRGEHEVIEKHFTIPGQRAARLGRPPTTPSYQTRGPPATKNAPP